MDVSEVMKQNLAIFYWKKGPEETPRCHLRVGIYRVMRRVDRERDQVIFECLLPYARDFINHLGSPHVRETVVEIRYAHNSTLDNPHKTTPLLRITDIRPKALWANRVVPAMYEGGPIRTFIQASCRIEGDDNFLFLGKEVQNEYGERLSWGNTAITN